MSRTCRRAHPGHSHPSRPRSSRSATQPATHAAPGLGGHGVPQSRQAGVRSVMSVMVPRRGGPVEVVRSTVADGTLPDTPAVT